MECLKIISQNKIRYTDEVRNAIRNNLPIVALESTIISFGLPYPHNLETAISCEKICRDSGVIPATIWFSEGKINVGALEKDINYLAKGRDIVKTNLSNLSIVLAKKNVGAATVSTSVVSAEIAGIKVFATGGIGGVHRDFKENFDISADLTALSEHSMIVVSAGVKSILDLRATVEHLETLGIPIIGYKTKSFPGFYYRDTEFSVDFSANKFSEVVEIYNQHRDIFPNKSILVTAPCPKKNAISKKIVEDAIVMIEREIAENKNNSQSYMGRDITPFMLKRLSELSGDITLSANISLIINNVSIAVGIAKAYAKFRK